MCYVWLLVILCVLSNLVYCTYHAATQDNEEGSWAQVRPLICSHLSAHCSCSTYAYTHILVVGQLKVDTGWKNDGLQWNRLLLDNCSEKDNSLSNVILNNDVTEKKMMLSSYCGMRWIIFISPCTSWQRSTLNYVALEFYIIFHHFIQPFGWKHHLFQSAYCTASRFTHTDVLIHSTWLKLFTVLCKVNVSIMLKGLFTTIDILTSTLKLNQLNEIQPSVFYDLCVWVFHGQMSAVEMTFWHIEFHDLLKFLTSILTEV